MVRICWDIKKCWNWKIEKLHQGWLILLLFVIICAWKFLPNLSQSPHPKTLAPQGLLAQQLRPSKGVQRLRGDVAHDLKLNNGWKCWDRFSIPKWWKPTIVDAKKTMTSLPTATVLLTHSVGCKDWSGSKSPQCGEKCWVLGPRKDRTRYSSTQSAFIYSRNATGPLEQYHNERPPAAPQTKTLQGWNGHRSYIKLYILYIDHPNLHISSLGRVGRAGHAADVRVPDTGEKR